MYVNVCRMNERMYVNAPPPPLLNPSMIFDTILFLSVLVVCMCCMRVCVVCVCVCVCVVLVVYIVLISYRLFCIMVQRSIYVYVYVCVCNITPVVVWGVVRGVDSSCSIVLVADTIPSDT